MASPGYLLVYSDSGDKISLEGFTDRYDNEHGHVSIPTSHRWYHWEAVTVDDLQPRWAASYDLASSEATQVPLYRTLSDTDNEREARIPEGTETLDIRRYEQLEVPLPTPSPLYDPTKPAPYALFMGVEVAEEVEAELNRYYDEEHMGMLAKCPGWIRSRRFVLKDWSRTSGGGATEGEIGAEQDRNKPPPKYLVVHEWASREWGSSEELEAATTTPWTREVVKGITGHERRLFKLYGS